MVRPHLPPQGSSREASVIGRSTASALGLFKLQDFQKPRVSIKDTTRQQDEQDTVFFTLIVYFSNANGQQQ